ncbi:hypothetical protein HRG_009465 [Hirsutella rhossiliensis]|uniref:Uncharacterized protein n=1 Tax=Hirsutella rhossiliensis TaxID=111463 RepID=A0A9P8MNZ5_9HYPO|nr:uncharacterized protein HRG_09465 [Hirsutella rhossiliensis]KAH0959683.1 hypothetical protein HRG_09465 [Hirsutella rhossiliensis]
MPKPDITPVGAPNKPLAAGIVAPKVPTGTSSKVTKPSATDITVAAAENIVKATDKPDSKPSTSSTSDTTSSSSVRAESSLSSSSPGMKAQQTGEPGASGTPRSSSGDFSSQVTTGLTSSSESSPSSVPPAPIKMATIIASDVVFPVATYTGLLSRLPCLKAMQSGTISATISIIYIVEGCGKAGAKCPVGGISTENVSVSYSPPDRKSLEDLFVNLEVRGIYQCA